MDTKIIARLLAVGIKTVNCVTFDASPRESLALKILYCLAFTTIPSTIKILQTNVEDEWVAHEAAFNQSSPLHEYQSHIID